MKRNITIILVVLLFTSCKENNQLNLDQIVLNYKKNVSNLEKVEYFVNRIDSFSTGLVWNNKGYGLIEKDTTDSLFGFYFYGKRFDNEKEALYYKSNGFVISPKTKSYSIKNNPGILFSDAGQMIVKEFFEELPSEYKSIELTNLVETYQIRYNFEDNEAYQTTDDHLIMEINKDNFFPKKITYSFISAGKKQVHQIQLDKIKINANVSSKVSEKHELIEDYSWIEEGTKNKSSKFVNTTLPKMVLPNLKTQKEYEFKKGQITLIDFWATWCGPCIKSFPKVEELYNEYSGRIEVIGVVLDNEETALKLIEKAQVSYMNLLGTTKIRKNYDIQSLPAYFLIDKDGVVIKHYTGFKGDAIKNDIDALLAK